MNDEFDGRDALVKRRYGQESLVAEVESQDTQVARYSEPWQRPYYTQFDDFLPRKMGLHASCVNGEHGRNAWCLPVTDVTHVTGGYEQVNIGLISIIEIPNYDTGEVEIFIGVEAVEE